MAALNIVTFGSCLSRYIARAYKRLYGGEIVSTVYHNRSDYFVDCFVERIAKPFSIEINEVLIPKLEVELNEDSRSIVLNQTPENIGKHKLDTELGLFEVLERGDVQLVIFDNFMDVSARISTGKGATGFLRRGDYENYDAHFSLGGYIDPGMSSKYFTRIVDFFSARVPSAQLCFVHFPYNTYEDEARRIRSLNFLKSFTHPRALNIPPLDVPKIYRTEEPSHFAEPQYAAYAGMIRAAQALQAFRGESLSFPK